MNIHTFINGDVHEAQSQSENKTVGCTFYYDKHFIHFFGDQIYTDVIVK